MMAQSMAPTGMTVYHGSPYKFSAFDPKKIGTGEGAQAYGHGLYVAENPEVAKGYQKSLSDFDIQVDGKPYNNEDVSHRAALIVNNAGSKEQAIKNRLSAYKDLSSRNVDWAQNLAKSTKEELNYLQSNKKIPSYNEISKGNFYKIDLPGEHIDKMLDYDAPLKNQPDALAKIRDSIDDLDIRKSFDYNVDKGISEANAYKNYVAGKTDAERSQTLSNLDIPGIKYLDQSSRGAGEGTRNFVIFPGNEDILKIQDMNGNAIND
jgi:hypothetical protein